MTPKVSILVPVYNASPFIERCAHSLFSQSFNEIEYVFVDDSTPDDSIERLEGVLKQYPERIPYVKIIRHLQNKGTSASRITGLENASAPYVQFFDNDDYADRDMIKVLYTAAQKEKADIVISDFFIEYPTHQEIISCELANSKQENIIRLITQDLSPTVWKQLIKRDLLNTCENVYIPGLDWIEDLNANIRLFYHAKKIIKIDAAFYHHVRYNPNSFTNFRTKRHFEAIIRFWNLTDDFLKKKSLCEGYENVIEFVKIRYKIGLMIGADSPKLRKEYSYLFRDFEMKYLHRFRPGEQLILFFCHYRLFPLASISCKFLKIKNRKAIK